MLAFGPFRLDEQTHRLWLGDVERPLRAKSFAVLRELARRRGRLTTKEEIFRACWPNTAVSQTVLRVCISEIRTVLAEDASAATAIENVGRRGYRLVATAGDVGPAPDLTIGREAEMRVLRRALARADAGIRQTVFVTGEPGLGKTTLLDHFAADTRTTSRARIGWGQCVELTGGTEPYLPILDVLGRLCADDPCGTVTAALERWAPTWLSQLPGLVDAARAESIARRVQSPNRDRMLRELGAALEALATDETLVVVLEDLHWSDFATVDVLAYLAQRRVPARLLVIGSYRPGDLALRDRPLQGITHGLVAQQRATEIPLTRWTRTDVDTYLTRRLTGSPIDGTLGARLHARTGGNPMFVTATVEYLLDRALLATSQGRWRVTTPLDGILPDGLRQLALRQVDRLAAADRRVLDAACVAGHEFATAAVAAAAELAPADVEDVCARLAEHTELVSSTGVDSWPDATVTGRYEFRHVVYREALEAALPPARRRCLHRAIGDRLEAAWAERSAEIAAELAAHFAAAADGERAMRHHVAAAHGARARFAEREAVVHLQAALTYLRERPDTTERARTELAYVLDLGGALVAARGAASEDVLEVHRRALELADALDQPHARFRAYSALYVSAAMRADLHRARDVAEQLVATAARLSKPLFGFVGHVSLGCALFNLGEFEGAERYLSQAQALWRSDLPTLTLDPAVFGRAMLGLTALIRATPDAAQWIDTSLAHAEAIRSPYNICYACDLAGQYWATAGDRERALEHATHAIAVGEEHGFVVHEGAATVVRGWALRDVEVVRDGIAQYERADAQVALSFFRGLLVEVLLDLGDVDTARTELAAAFSFVQRTGEHRHLAELYRLQGERHRREGASPHACYERALTVARQQGARLWELRATISTAEAVGTDGDRQELRAMLDASLAPFADVCELPDVCRARALRATL